jgi:senataxin
MGMNHYDWADAVYESRIDAPVVPAESHVRKVMLAQKLNNPQARAVIASLETPGFSLIQGPVFLTSSCAVSDVFHRPPGCGKTTTICGLVGAFLSSRGSPVTAIQVGKTGNKSAIPRKALVCAPSNAAIDEVAKRIKDGVWKADGSKMSPNVVRLGADSSINVSVRDISLEELVGERMSRTNSNHSEAATEIATLRVELSRVKQLRQEKLDELQSSKTSSTRMMELEQDLKALSSKRIQLSSRLTTAQDRDKEAARAVDSAKRKARLDVLNDADVICCTLSGSGHDIIEQFEFDLVIIDEAAQAIELSSLIPLKFSSNQCIMVGGMFF